MEENRRRGGKGQRRLKKFHNARDVMTSFELFLPQNNMVISFIPFLCFVIINSVHSGGRGGGVEVGDDDEREED